MSDSVSEIVLEGDEKSFTGKVIRQDKKLKFVSKTLSLPEPTFSEVRHLMSDKPLRFAPRQFAD
jgi:hypothetical protein